MGRIAGKSVVITGAGSGIGRAASLLFASEGANLVIADKMDTVHETAELVKAAGGKVETVQKMDKKAFARIADKRHTSGFYANVIFDGTPAIIATLQKKFSLNEDVFRVLFTLAPAPKVAA